MLTPTITRGMGSRNKARFTDIKYVTLVFLRKSIEIFLNNPFVSEVEKSNFPPLLVFHSISILVIKIAWLGYKKSN